MRLSGKEELVKEERKTTSENNPKQRGPGGEERGPLGALDCSRPSLPKSRALWGRLAQ